MSELDERAPRFDAGWLRRAAMATESDAAEATRRLEVAKLRSLFRTAFAHAPIGMAIVDPDGQIVIANDALTVITNRTSEELLRSTVADLIAPADRTVDAEDRERLLSGELASYRAQVRVERPDGREVRIAMTVSQDGVDPVSLIYMIEDVTERRRLATRLEYLVDHDLLTGLFNRRRFQQELQRQVDRHRRFAEGGAVLMIDLDGFKEVNDQFGHATGDELLRGLSAAMRHRSRSTDVLARLSGDEFALLLPATNRDQAERVAGQLLTMIRNHTTVLGSERAQVTASVGIALFDGVGDAELMALSDAAMYAAKESGRDRFVVFDPDERRPVSRRAGEAGRLRRALRDRRFLLHCQPIWSLAERRVAQYELLIRMRGDADELIPPNAFLYAAERFGLVGAIDSWVVSQAVELIAAQAERGNRVVLAVNLSGRSVGDPAVAEHIDRCLERSGVDPSCLVFELTETAAISNIDSAVDLAERLHRHGCGLALDDFGAGFASFSYLKNLPFDYIKIDGDFVRGLAESATDRLLIDAIVTMARGMGRRTIAEFVADATTSDLLEASGVDYAQGFHIGRPAPVGAVLDALGDPGGPPASGGRRRR